MSHNAVTQEAMAGRIAAGHATPLLPDGVPGPVHLGGQWWAIAQGEERYERVTDAAQFALLDRQAQRLSAAHSAR
jgi:hypothetical protein